MSKTTGTTIPHCKWDDIRNLQIPLPTTDFQASIVRRMDTLQEQIEYLEAMQKQSKGDIQLLFELRLDST